MSLLHHALRVKVKVHLFADAVKVVQDAEAFGDIQLCTLGTEGGEVGAEICTGAGKVGTSLFYVLFEHRDGDVLLLNDAVALHRLIQQHPVVFPAVDVPRIPAQRHKNVLLKVDAIQAAVVDCDLCGSPGIQTVQQLGILEKHGLLICAAGDEVVDVREAVHFGVLVPDEKNAVRPDAPDGDHVLHAAGNTVFLFILLEKITEGLYHAVYKPLFHELL